ncbi:hypothetical protein ScPMuIL_001222 [Solemya velum]
MGEMGCEHYKRKCHLIAPCCGKEVSCRVCHDESENHELIRNDVKKVKCLKCNEIQEVRQNCIKCNTLFGKYFCQLCCLYDDVDKKQFHCDSCGICRVGGRNNFFHCETCDVCLASDLKNNHKCIERTSHSNCPVCLEYLHTSRTPLCKPDCGHFIHRDCFSQMLKTGNYACAVCGVSMVDMNNVWHQLDEEVSATKMPVEYRNTYVQILCKDCHKESRVLFHVIGMKCTSCGSYNTCRTGGDDDFDSDEAEDKREEGGGDAAAGGDPTVVL